MKMPWANIKENPVVLIGVVVFFSFFVSSDIEKLEQKVQQFQALVQKQQMKIKSLTAAASSSISRPSPGEATGAEATTAQGW